MKVIVVIGTRPEAIKMAPIIIKLKADNYFDVKVCLTGQHTTMVVSVLDFFGVQADKDFNVMAPNQPLAEVTSKIIVAFDQYLKNELPDLVLVQGDTTTAFACALASFYRQVKIGHVEAGLRTWNKLSPFPEEFNRTAIGQIADLHFAPTTWSQENLKRGKTNTENVYITGNTVIDALLLAIENLKTHTIHVPGIPQEILSYNKKLILITGHRRENFGSGFEQICDAIATLAVRYKDIYFVYPVHLNPNVKEIVNKRLSGYDNIFLIPPLDYPTFVYLMQKSYLILTDSGGVQEEAPSLGKPVLVMRNTTERPEGINAGTVKLVGTSAKTIIDTCSMLIDHEEKYAEMALQKNPYGDGESSQRILDIIKSAFK